MPKPVLDAMAPYVDVVSMQYYCGPDEKARAEMITFMGAAHAGTGKPVLNADVGNWAPTKLNPDRVWVKTQAERGSDYVAILSALVEQPWCVGMHWCSYLENTARGWGIKDPWDEPYVDFVEPMRKFNKKSTAKWAGRFK